MTNKIKERIDQLRQEMQKNDLQAYIVPTSDPHLSEYIAPCWMLRKWLTGFTGSAGTLVVTESEAGLWTDSRYYLQAEEQLKDSGINLFKDGLPDVPTYMEYLCELDEVKRVGLNGKVFSAEVVDELTDQLDYNGKELCPEANLDYIWTSRPALPSSKVFLLDTRYAGQTAADKLGAICQKMDQTGSDYCIISALDEIAWTLNLRGNDVEYNPVFYAFLLVSHEGAILFADSCDKATGRHLADNKEVTDYLNQNHVNVKPYDEIYSHLAQLVEQQPDALFMLDRKMNNAAIASLLPDENLVDEDSPVAMLKAVKNETEIGGLRQAQVADGVAMTQAFCWLDKMIESGERVTEMGFACYLDNCRAQQPDYVELSFGTISGFAAHGAIVHYTATQKTDIDLHKGNFLLVDSGGNYLKGTTDITRTVLLGGTATEQQKRDYTLVLKGHIALANARFPEGTTGTQLDVLAHQYLWQEGKNYGHGTGHGIGHFLCVHEGPQRISTHPNATPLLPGMFISNEPGLYVTNQYGIRIENMVCVKNFKKTDFGQFYELETMSHFPFDLNAIDASLLTDAEKEWINSYHRDTFRIISGTGLLSDEELEWLRNKTTQIV